MNVNPENSSIYISTRIVLVFTSPAFQTPKGSPVVLCAVGRCRKSEVIDWMDKRDALHWVIPRLHHHPGPQFYFSLRSLSRMSTENTSDFENLQEKFGRFRVLIVGRANAGKTTILRGICNTTENPEVYDGDGNKVGNQLNVLVRRLVYAKPRN